MRRLKPFGTLATLLCLLSSGCTWGKKPFELPSDSKKVEAPSLPPAPPEQTTPSGLPPPAGSTAADLCADDTPPATDEPFRKPIDTWENIHAFLVFDYNMTAVPPGVFKEASRYDYVWGAGKPVESRRGNPNIRLSDYIPYNRDPDAQWLDPNNAKHDFLYYKNTHPDWIVYKCDKTTPAYEFNQELVPLDITNPKVIEWQVSIYGTDAIRVFEGVPLYDAIAGDNFFLINIYGACGIWKNGVWKQLYTGELYDSKFAEDAVNWLGQMRTALHALPTPLALIVNLSPFPPDEPLAQKLIQNVDSVVDEQVFMLDGLGYPKTDAEWLKKMAFLDQLQKARKSYYGIYQIEVAGDPKAPLKDENIQWALAYYLMGKGHGSALYLSRLYSSPAELVQDYGSALWYPEFDAKIGHPCGAMRSSQNIYMRDYSNGLSLVNPSVDQTYTVTLDPKTSFVNLKGTSVGPSVVLPPHSGLVLLKK